MRCFLVRQTGFGLLLVAALCIPLQACAEGWTFDDARADWQEFALGFVASYAAHEAGHILVAKSKGYEVGHNGISIVYPHAQFTHADQLQIASAGFQTQWLLDEAAFHDLQEPRRKPGNFGAGMICSQLGTTLAYLTVLKNHPRGDIAGMSQATGLSHDRLALIMAVPGLLDGWRLFGNDVPAWVPKIAVVSKSVRFAWIWTY